MCKGNLIEIEAFSRSKCIELYSIAKIEVYVMDLSKNVIESCFELFVIILAGLLDFAEFRIFFQGV